MRVHLIRKETIEEFARENGQSRISLNDWLNKIKYADWELPSDIKFTFPTADLLGSGSSRAVFNIAGNQFRLICKYAFGDHQVRLFVCWIGTHRQYTELCVNKMPYTVSDY